MTTSPVWGGERRAAAFLVAAAIVLYVPGIWWGLPYATAPDRISAWGSDELAPLGPIAELYSVFIDPNPTFNPQYPLAHYLAQAVPVGPYVLSLWLTGRLSHPAVEYPFGLSDPVTALAVMALLARSVSLLMAAGTVVAAFRTAATLWDRGTGAIAGVLVLLTYPMFYYARTSNVDMGAMFWTGLGLAVFAACLRDGLTPRRAVWLGVFAALATATKDASYAVFLALLLVLAPQFLRQQRRLGAGWQQSWQAPAAGLISGLGVYAVASGLVFHPGRYLIHVNFITHGAPPAQGLTYYSAPATLRGYLILLGATSRTVVDAMGAPMAVFALAGLALCWFRARQTLAFGLPILGVVLGVIFPVRFVLLRFVIVMAYIFACFAAYALAAALRAPGRLFRRSAQLSLAIVCGWSLLRGADLTYQMIYDSRYQLAAWFRRNAKPGNRVGYYGSSLKLPPLDFGIVTAPMPGQLFVPAGLGVDDGDPEFIVVIPQQPFEPVHEFTLPEDAYQALADGTTGYRQVLGLQTRSLFPRRPISFVNPPVQVFVRQDYLDRIPDGKPWTEITN